MENPKIEKTIEKAEEVLARIDGRTANDDAIALRGIGYAILALTEVLKNSLEKEKKV